MMKKRIAKAVLLIGVGIMVGGIIGGLRLRTRGVETVRIQNTPIQRLLFQKLEHLRKDSLVEGTDAEFTSFILERESALMAKYEAFLDEEKRAREEIRDILESCSEEELAQFTPDDPDNAKQIMMVMTRRDEEGRRPVFIDPADWDGFFERTPFGFGAQRALKDELLRQWDNQSN